MLYNKLLSRYFSPIANLVAAFGGGMILGKGIGVINYPYLQSGSILAFFIGTILGLGFLQCVPKRLSKVIAQFFSMGCGLTSLLLFYIFQNFADNERLNGISALIFFLFLSLRFGLWFYSRVMRASHASEYQQSIAGVEFGYYLGMVLGLIVWKLFGITIGLSSALILDVCFQLFAGFLDLRSFALKNVSSVMQKLDTALSYDNQSDTYSLRWCWKMASAVVFFTIGIQVIIFNAAHHVADSYSPYILATFYLGVAIAAFLCGQYKSHISWEQHNHQAIIMIGDGHRKTTLRVLPLTLISSISVMVVVGYIHSNHLILNNQLFTYFVLCVFIFIAAFFYEILSIALLDRLGFEEKKLNHSGMIMRTYGLMGVGAAVSLWMLSSMPNQLVGSLVMLITSLIFALFAVLNRKPEEIVATSQVKMESA